MTVTTWATVGGLAVATALVKAAGPVIFGGRELPPLLARIIPLLPAALLAALVVIETLGGPGRGLRLDARALGVAAAALALGLRRSIIVVVVAAAATTALARAAGFG
jgi:branched-subunit amino acid transport protein